MFEHMTGEKYDPVVTFGDENKGLSLDINWGIGNVIIDEICNNPKFYT